MPDDRHTPLRRWAPRILIGILYLGVVVMLVVLARKLDWNEVREAVLALPAHRLVLAGVFSAICYAFYAGYELLAARHAGLKLRRAEIAALGFAGYACNLTLGATLGAVGLRIRLYAARGVGAGRAMSLVAFNLLTNWSGYLLVLGASLVALWSPTPPGWSLHGLPLRLVGGGLLGVLMGYLVLCRQHSDRTWHWRNLRFRLPTLKVAFLQLALSAPVWLLGAASLNVLLPEVPYDLLLVSLLGAAIAGTIVRIPAGLGVIEATLLASLGPTTGQGKLLAALLAYRCIHYLVPLAFGLLTVAGLEMQTRTRKHGMGPVPEHS